MDTGAHEHQFHPHAHIGLQWCSARFWCAGCKTWISGSACKGMRSALPSLPGVSRKGR